MTEIIGATRLVQKGDLGDAVKVLSVKGYEIKAVVPFSTSEVMVIAQKVIQS